LKKIIKIICCIAIAYALLFLMSKVAPRVIEMCENKRLDIAIENFYDKKDPEAIYLSFYSLFLKHRYKEVVDTYPEIVDIFTDLKLEYVRNSRFIMLQACKKLGISDKREQIIKKALEEDPAHGHFLYGLEVYEIKPLEAQQHFIIALRSKKSWKPLDPEMVKITHQIIDLMHNKREKGEKGDVSLRDR